MTLDERIKIATRNAPYVANAIKHVWLARLLQVLWEYYPESKLQIFTSEVDDAGYDIVLTLATVTRHVQLKASHVRAKRQSIDVNTALAQAEGGCVVWIFYDPVTLDIQKYRFFGSEPGKPMADLSSFNIAKRVFPDMTGKRPERPRIRAIPKSACVPVSTLDELIEKLFGLTIPKAKTEP
jgi:hypothetical protein